MTDGRVWGVDLDNADYADRRESIDLLHVDTDPHTEEQTLRWFDLYASRCGVIALHDAHHPAFGVGRAVRAFVARGGWAVHEYWAGQRGQEPFSMAPAFSAG
ncbi:hypothetical protein [Paludisphaera borealis]|uniref:hypothetical protein n=1 Tax=Paludisphaera borealis TaxID=1387353 RepID=UPI00097128D1|nr:hypothetical protein [Paludisphaera borealis]